MIILKFLEDTMNSKRKVKEKLAFVICRKRDLGAALMAQCNPKQIRQ